jgi:type I restriction enzyme S subunit
MTEVIKIPRLRFPEFSKDWDNKRLGDLIEIKGRIGYRGYTINDIVKKGEGSISLSPSNIDKDGNISFENSTYISWEKYYESPEIIIEEGFTILVKTGSSFGKSGFVKELSEKSTINPQLVVLKPIKVNEHILYILTTLPSVQKQINTMVVGGTIPTLSQENISNFKVKTPILTEQKKISEFLTSVDRRIELMEKKKSHLETYKKGVMKKIFSQEIRFKDDDGNDFPEWENKRLGDVCKIQKGIQLNKSELLDIGSYPAINGGMEPSGYTEIWNTESNTITISEGGNSCGYVNFIKTEFWSGGHCYSLLELKNLTDKNYLFQYLKGNEKSIMNLRVGSGLPNIQKRDIDGFELKVPSLNEQQKISTFLSSIDNQIELLDSQIKKSKTWKKGLLQKMFV